MKKLEKEERKKHGSVAAVITNSDWKKLFVVGVGVGRRIRGDAHNHKNLRSLEEALVASKEPAFRFRHRRRRRRGFGPMLRLR